MIINYFTELYTKLANLKRTNADLKILVAVGGWNAGTTGFESICQSNRNMQTFAHNVISFLRSHQFDGFDLDWEYPSKSGAGGKQMFTDLAKVRGISILSINNKQ